MKYKKIVLFLPLIIYISIIFILSHQNKNPDFINDNFGMDKIVHTFVYAGLALVLNFTLIKTIKKQNLRLIIIIMFGILFAVSDEFHQSFIPGRESSIWDVLFDTVGISIVVIFIKLKTLFFKNNSDRSIIN